MHTSFRASLLIAMFASIGLMDRARAADPELTTISKLTGAVEDTAYEISYGDINSASDATDGDGDSIGFVLKSSAGTIALGDDTPVTAGDVLESGDIWYWTPPQDANGDLVAFSVRASDGSGESATDVDVTVAVDAVNDAPTFVAGLDVSVVEDSPAQTIQWATDIEAGPANEITDGQGIQAFTIASGYDQSLFSVQPAISTTGSLTFTPAADEYGSVDLTVNLVDDGGTANAGDDDTGPNTTLKITITSVEDDPMLAGSLGEGGTVGSSDANPLSDVSAGGGGEGTFGEVYTVFDSLTVSDRDQGKPTSSPVTESLDVSVALPNDIATYGEAIFPRFNGSDWTKVDETYSLTGLTPSDVESALATVTFAPASNAKPVNIYELGVTVTVSDQTAGTTAAVSSNATTGDAIWLESVNDAPEVTASVAPDTISDFGTESPLRLSVIDPDPGDTFSVTVTETSAPSRGVLTLPASPMTGDAAAIDAAVRSITFTPNPQNSVVTADFQFDVVDVHPAPNPNTPAETGTSANTSLTITFDNDAPQLSGVTTELIRITDDPGNTEPTKPFLTISVSDADPGQILTALVTLDDAAKGSLVPSSVFDAGFPGQITGTASQITDKLRSIEFEPTGGRSANGQSETVTITVTIDDGYSTALSNSATQIEVTSVNGAPDVLWDPTGAGNAAGSFPPVDAPALIDPNPAAPAGVVIPSPFPAGPRPFEKVEIEDDGDVSVSIAIDDPAKGSFVLETLGGSGGFVETEAESGIFEFTGTPTTATDLIHNIVYLPNPDYLFPPGEPGRTDFTISASDASLNATTRVLPIVLISDSRNFLVTRTLDDPSVPGTLRHALVHARNNDVITFALPTYPSVIRLSALDGLGSLMLDRHLTLLGPGSDMLTISGDANANGITDPGDVQLMEVFATVRVKGLTLSGGFAGSGGAAHVGRANAVTRPGELILEDCVIRNCMASFWGGAIDVEQGSLRAERCLFEQNALSVSSGLGGGAVALWTDLPSVFENCTFSGNQQGSPTGYGGGGIYAESYSASFPVPIAVTHCTFAENLDASAKGSSIHSNVAHTEVILRNSLFGDGSSRNLQVAGFGEILSEGGNLSDDNTSTALIQGGDPGQNYILDSQFDQRGIPVELGPIGVLEGPTKGYRPLPSSPAIGRAVAGVSMVDQRGVIRVGAPDVGAVDVATLGRVLVHEVFISKGSPENQFIEFINPRNQGPVDLSKAEIRVDGVTRYTFPDASPVIQPGFGFILAADAANWPEPTVPDLSKTPVFDGVPAADNGLGLSERGVVEIFAFTASDGLRLVESASYVGVFVNENDPTGTPLNFDTNSVTLAPQSQGAAFVPNGTVKAGPPFGVDKNNGGASVSPGSYAGTNTPFGEPNARPFAVADRLEISEDEFSVLDVLANDVDADGSDELFIVDLNVAATDPSPQTGNTASLLRMGAPPVTVMPGGTPLRGVEIEYDPRVAYNYLPSGARVTDTFAYSIIDVGGGPIAGISEDPLDANNTIITAIAHRLADGAGITISGADNGDFNGDFNIEFVDDDRFIVDVPFVDPTPAPSAPPAALGNWLADLERIPSARSEATVEVIILGRNDAPIPGDDLALSGTDEDSVLRIFADREAGDSIPVLDTDINYPLPREVEPVGILRNDDDPDSNDKPFTQLDLVGVCQASDITDFTGVQGAVPVTVTSAGHGLTEGESILISGYEGHPSYNNYHLVGNVTEDTFTIPITFVDNVDAAVPASPKARWARLDDTNRFQTESAFGAEVTLEIRADRDLTNIVFNARSSTELNALADGESVTDSFYYAVADTSGAVSLALVEVPVVGVNDEPIPTDDPPGLVVLDPFVSGGSSLPDTAGESTVLYTLPVPDSPGVVDVAVTPPGQEEGVFVVIKGIDWTHEDAALDLLSSRFTDNDGEVDTTDDLTLEIDPGMGQNLSLYGAEVRLNGDATILTYDPTNAQQLQALAFKERVIDVVSVGVSDGLANVPTTFIVVVEGRNDSPVASNASYTVDEKTLLSVSPPGLLDSGLEIDQNTLIPDNRKFLLPAEGLETTVFGASVDFLLEPRQGGISGFSAVSGVPDATGVQSAGHGLQSGEEVMLPESGPLTGQYKIERLDDDSFSIPIPFDAANASWGGTWRVLTSTFQYDPRASVFSGPSGDPTFTLQGLAWNQDYVDTIDYTLLDGSHLFANDDIFRIEVDRVDIELRVLENDSGLGEDLRELELGQGPAEAPVLRRIISVGPPSSGGSVVLNGDQSIIYTPETGFVGDEVFTYTIEDQLGNRDTALVTARVTIDRLNGNLRANPDRFTVATTQAPLLDVLANDSIIPNTGAPLTLVEIVDGPDQGGSAETETGQIRYAPSDSAVSFPYTETFSYRMSGGGTTSAVTTVSVLVVDRTETLNARADSFSVPAGSTNNTLNVLENDNVLPANGESFEIISTQNGPFHGEVTPINGDALSYTPDPGFLGTDTFDYTVSDGFGGTKTASVSVSVGYLVTNPDIFSVAQDNMPTPAPVTLDVLSNDNVIQGGLGGLIIESVVAVDQVVADALGSIEPSVDGQTLEFTPISAVAGQADFIYTVRDSSNRTSTGLLTVVVISDGVRASSDYFTVQADSSENQLAILANDLRLSPDPGEISIGSIGIGPDGPDQGGAVEIVEAGPGEKDYLLYAPAPGFVGTESFTYTVTDGTTNDTARVSIRVTAGAMVAADDDYLVFRGSAGNRLSVLLNDRVIPDGGQSLFVTAIAFDPANNVGLTERGTLEIVEGGAALSYTPSLENGSSAYTETFTYEISSGGTERAEGRIRIQVVDRVGVRDLETNDDVFEVRSDSPGTALPVLSNDSVLPASPDGWVISGVSPPTVTVCDSFLFLPSDFVDPSAFAALLSAQDTPLTSYLWGEFSVPAQALLANPSSEELALQESMAQEFNALVQGGMTLFDSLRFESVALRPSTQYLIDSGAVGDELLILNRMLLEDAFPQQIQLAPSGGSLQVVGTDVIYVPQPGFVGSVQFRYMVADGLGGTGSALVTVKVGDVSVSDDSYTVLAGSGPVPLGVTFNDGVLRTAFPGEPDPAQADFTLTTMQPVTVDPVAAGTAEVVDGMVEFSADPGFVGTATLTYWVEDDGACTYPGIAHLDVRSPLGDESTAQVSVTVTGVNDEPMLIDAGPGNTDDETQVNPFANATVIEYDDQRQEQVTLVVSYNPARGTLVGAFTEISPGVLQFVGTAEEITAALRALVFTPTINRIPVGTTEDTLFSVSLDDGYVSPPVVVDTAIVTVTPVNQSPVLTGTVGDQKLYQYSSMRPFSGVDINDVDDLGLQAQTVTVQIDDPIKGQLSILGGFVEVVPGTYVMTDTPSGVSSALRALLFTPTPGDRVTPDAPEVAQFTITVDDGFAVPVVDDVTTVTILHGQVDRILPLDGTGGDASEAEAEFGDVVSISGDTLVSGSPFRDGVAANEGRVFVYERESGFGLPWGQVAEIAASDPAVGSLFGSSVSIDGDRMIVGAPGDDESGRNTGAAYLFERSPSDSNVWVEVSKILPPTVNGSGGDAFGSAVAIHEDTMLIGSPGANLPGAPRSGKAFIYRRIAGTWTAGEALVASDNRVNALLINDRESFGASVALEGDTAVVGSPNANLSDSVFGWDYGAAYIFTRPAFADPFVELTRIDEFADPDSLNYSGFGFSVDLSGDRLLIGRYSASGPNGAFRGGSVQLRERNQDGADQWGLVQEFAPSSGGNSTPFGYSVAVSGDLLMIGSPGPDFGSDDARGAVDVYRYDAAVSPSWTQIDRFMPGEEGAEDRYGHSVALDGFTGVAGAQMDGANSLEASEAGAVYAYQFQYDLGPRLVMPFADFVVEEGVPFSVTISPESFSDPIYPDDLVIGVELSDGSSLPAAEWLAFNPSTGVLEGTPTVTWNRDYELVAYAVNPLGSRVSSAVFTIEVVGKKSLQSAYDAWAATQFAPSVVQDAGLESTVWGMDVDQDGDGRANVLDMLFGFSATVQEPSPMVFTYLGSSRGLLSFPLSADFPTDAMRVEWSADLLIWNQDSVTYDIQPDTPSVRRVEALIAPPGNPGRFFVRIVTTP